MQQVAEKTVRNGHVIEPYAVLVGFEDRRPLIDRHEPDSVEGDIVGQSADLWERVKEPVPASDVAPGGAFEAGLAFAARALRALARDAAFQLMSAESALMVAADRLDGGNVCEEDRPARSSWSMPGR
jgi:NADPH-dependent 2,4-dienoyl-CoA reductase/sulfur reductase-like enzyme